MPLWMSVCDDDKYVQVNLARLNLGVPVMLCAPGPTLEPLTPQPGLMVAALTKAYPTVRPDVWFGMDEPGCYDRRIWSESFIKIGNSSYPDRAIDGRKVRLNPLTFLAQTKKSEDVLDIFRERGSQKKFTWYKHTLGVACDILVWMGARTIYLDGFDLRHIDGKDYCEGARKVLPTALRDRNQQLFDQQVHFLRAFHAYAKPNGIDVISVTPDSPVNAFMEFMPRAEAIKRAAAAVPGSGTIYHCREINAHTGEPIAVVHPFSPSGLKAAIADAKSRAERQVVMQNRRELAGAVEDDGGAKSDQKPVKKNGLRLALTPAEAEIEESKQAKNPDTPEQFAKIWGGLKHAIIEQALPYRETIPVPAVDRHKVGFFFPSANLLAHAVNAQTMFNALADNDGAIDPICYTIGKQSAAWDAAFPNTRYCAGAGLVDALLNVRGKARADGVSAMVFVSTPSCMTFLSTIGVAPRSIWWAMKWHGLELPYLDGYVDGCHQFRDTVKISGRVWPCTYTALPEMLDPMATAAARRQRAAMPASTVFGAFAREEKFTKDYAETVKTILDLAPGSSFVYGARRPLEWMESIIGADRCKFVGWVYTRLWAQIIDVYLDTFPFMGGHTVFETMAASKPVVWIESPAYADEQTVAEMFDAERWRGYYRQDPVARSKEEFIENAVEYAKNPDLRELDGHAGRRFFDDHLRDTAKMARQFSAEVLKIINKS